LECHYITYTFLFLKQEYKPCQSYGIQDQLVLYFHIQKNIRIDEATKYASTGKIDWFLRINYFVSDKATIRQEEALINWSVSTLKGLVEINELRSMLKEHGIFKPIKKSGKAWS
jgi:hypothetical protein